MPVSAIGQLVEEALTRLPEPYTENVTHDVFRAIEADAALRCAYDKLCEQYGSGKLSGRHNVNQTIPHWVKKLTGRTVSLEETDSPGRELIRTYTKLG